MQIPSRHQIGNPLLNSESEKILELRKRKFESANSLALFVDGWSGCDNRWFINFLAACPEPIFLKSVETGIQPHTADFIAAKLREVVEELGPAKVSAICTDNSANMNLLGKLSAYFMCTFCAIHVPAIVWTWSWKIFVCILQHNSLV